MIFEAWEMDRDDAEEFDVSDHGYAAKKFAETLLGDDPSWEEVEVSVAAKGSDEVKTFTVRCDWKAVLTVWENRE